MTPIADDHINFAKATLNYLQQAAAENASDLLKLMAECRRRSAGVISPKDRKEAREQMLNLKGQIDAYNALITLASDVGTSIENFKGEDLQVVCEVASACEIQEEETSVIVSPEG